MDFKKVRGFFISLALILISFSFLGSLLVIAAYSVPNKYIEDNVRLSREILEKENAYDGWTEIFTHGWAGNLDSTTDVRIFNDVITDPEKGILQSAFGSYARMWNGYMVLYRPLLIFFSYAQIRFLLYCVIAIMTWYVCTLLHDRLGTAISFAYMISLILANIILVPFNMIMSVFIIVTSLFSIAALKYYNKGISLSALFTAFMISGMTDIYFDMLTAPLLIPCMPLLMILLLDAREDIDIRKEIIKIFGCMLSWATGYGLFWFMKWIISSFATGENIIANAVNTALFRVGGETEGKTGSVYSLAKNFGALFPTHGENIPGIIGVIIAIIIIMAVLLIKRKPDRTVLRRYLPCFLVMLFPVIWYIIISNHSIIHATMYSYRLLMIPVFGFLSVYFELIK